jgi:hypothetical protein
VILRIDSCRGDIATKLKATLLFLYRGKNLTARFSVEPAS